MTIMKVLKNKKIKQNKTKAEISRLSPDYFLGRVWPKMPGSCGLFLCVIAGNFITC